MALRFFLKKLKIKGFMKNLTIKGIYICVCLLLVNYSGVIRLNHHNSERNGFLKSISDFPPLEGTKHLSYSVRK